MGGDDLLSIGEMNWIASPRVAETVELRGMSALLVGMGRSLDADPNQVGISPGCYYGTVSN